MQIPVKSSWIKSFNYDEASQTLTAHFTDGESFRYAGVPHDVVRRVCNASSVGSAFKQQIAKLFEPEEV